MRSGGCWSSVVATVQERAALRLTPTHDWLVACVLPAGHDGAHASDGAQQHAGRRRWLLWGDYARGAQNLADEFECSAQALDGAPCMFFAGHGGHHRYAAPLGEDFPANPSPQPFAAPPFPAQADSGRHEMRPSGPDGVGRHGGRDSIPSQAVPPEPRPVAPPWMPAAGPASPNPVGATAPRPHAGPAHLPPLPPEDESISVASLDALFAGMPSLKDLPHTELLAFPEGSFRSVAPSWPDSRGEYVAEHHLANPVDREVVVSGPDRFEPAEAQDDEIIDVEEVPDPARGRRRAKRDRSTEPTTGRHGAVVEAEPDPAAEDVPPGSCWMEVRPGAASVLTTPMVQVISSNDDPVRMGVPTARRRLAVDGDDLESVTSAVEDAADRLRALPEADGEVSAALQDVGQALARLSDILRNR
ncbi:hypothetical protein [Gordonia phthalatica]|uniref:Uncharacterized protein n=1 Tax=Gordonia phthalatica TaxID=1136941 RepID=A0A0N9NKR8_9ACTN|nr:hypothetical protein [Gordonia phthalatica]ALG86320.1 hypothetical protein ACH46_19805 [Gordonia phthalatica]